MKTPTIQSKEILQKGKFLSLSRLTLAHPDGRVTPYEVVERNSEKVFWIVSILPITHDGHVIMIRQYRAPLHIIQLELPAGCAEVGKHDSLEDAVHAELREETGYRVGKLTHIAEFSSSSGMTNETVHGYVAENCRKVSDVLSLDETEYIERVSVPYTEFDQFILSEIARGAIVEPKMLALMWTWRNMVAKK
jgi:ADP-ribose pyrophosphatase